MQMEQTVAEARLEQVYQHYKKSRTQLESELVALTSKDRLRIELLKQVRVTATPKNAAILRMFDIIHFAVLCVDVPSPTSSKSCRTLDVRHVSTECTLCDRKAKKRKNGKSAALAAASAALWGGSGAAPRAVARLPLAAQTPAILAVARDLARLPVWGGPPTLYRCR